MSLIPFILDLADELHEFSRCLANGIDINDFGFGLYTGSEQQNQSQPPSASTSPQQQQSPRRSRTSSFSSFWMPTKRHHPYNRIKSACCGKSAGEEGGATGTNATTASPEKDATPVPTPNKTASYSVVNKNGFQVSMNVKQFAPNELSVKTIDNCIVVEGRHDDKEDGHGVISRHFVRKYMLPKGYDPKDVMSTLSSDGILTVKAPPPPPPSAKVDEPNERIVEIQPTPGPTQVVPATVSAGAQPKEQTKKPLSPAAREECQLPEKRQKLDVAQQQQPQMDKKQEVVQEEQDTVKQQQAHPTQTIPATKTTQSQSTSTPPQSPASGDAAAAGAGALNDNEKVEEEQTAEIDDKQQQQQQQHQQKEDDRVDGKGEQQQQTEEEITDVETNNAVAAITTAEEDKTENQLETKESAMEIDETENNKTAEADEEGGEERDMVEKKLPETNGSDNIGEIAEANEPAAESCTNTNTTTSSAEKSNDEVPAEAVCEADGQPPESNAMEVDGDDDVAEQTNNTAADEDATNVGAGEDKLKEGEKEKKADDKCPETAENSNSTPINNDKEDNKANSKSTGETPADAADSVAAESANDKVSDAETAVDTTTATATTIATDIDVALLKKAAATADAAEITAAAENALLSEPMDGIATTDSPVDTVECSLFAKSLGNGNSNSAAALVAKEEVAN